MTDTALTASAPDWQVVANHAGCYSVWPAGQPMPAGWRLAGPTGPREECLDWIAGHWVDPRPAGVGRPGGAA